VQNNQNLQILFAPFYGKSTDLSNLRFRKLVDGLPISLLSALKKQKSVFFLMQFLNKPAGLGNG
jgi:hypothetical protein